MKILIIGGFLGSGKTTIINRLIRGMTGEGLRIAIVQNETGEVQVDQTVLKSGDTSVIAVGGGCVCCELFGNLLETIDKIRLQTDPDWLIIETAGLASLDSIRNNLELYGSKENLFNLIAVADCERFDLLWEVIPPLLTGQFSGADLILLSKSDICGPSEQLRSVLLKTAHDAPILDTSETELWISLKKFLNEHAPHAGSR